MRWLALAVLLSGTGCGALGAGPPVPSVPHRGGTHHEHAPAGVRGVGQAELWVSYQIAVDAIDGVPTSYAAEDRSLYYRISLPAGERVLTLRLDYRAPTHRLVMTGGIDKIVQLEEDRAYRLLDLSAAETSERTFTPWLLQGAPRDEVVELERPAR